jgi:hypothetical protein
MAGYDKRQVYKIMYAMNGYTNYAFLNKGVTTFHGNLKEG